MTIETKIDRKTLVLNITRQRDLFRTLFIGTLALLAVAVSGMLYLVGDQSSALTTARATIEEFKGHEALYEDLLALNGQSINALKTKLTEVSEDNNRLRQQVADLTDTNARTVAVLAEREQELADKSKQLINFNLFSPEKKEKSASTTTMVAEKEDAWYAKAADSVKDTTNDALNSISTNAKDAYNSVIGLFEKK